MASRVILITNPDFDDATKYLSDWSDAIITFLKSKSLSIDVHELKRDRATKEHLTKLVIDKNPSLILFHGHGNHTSIFGFESNILIQCEVNELLLKDRIVHSLTCNSGAELGPKSIVIGTKSFIGYKKEFKFNGIGDRSGSNLCSDNLARIFLEPAFEVEKALVEGESSLRAYQRSQQMYNDNLQLLLTSSNPYLNSLYASRLYHDLINQVILGDPNSTC